MLHGSGCFLLRPTTTALSLPLTLSRPPPTAAAPLRSPCSQQLGQDARLASSEFDWIREEWTHEQIMDLIVGGGKFVHPDKVKVCTAWRGR